LFKALVLLITAVAAPISPPDDEAVSGDAMPDGVSGPPDARLTVAAVARRLGVAPATLRTWDRRYGLGPTLHAAGAHRRYSRTDIARLEAMRRLVLDGVPPADAARIAVDRTPPDGPDGPPPGPSGRLSVLDTPAPPPEPAAPAPGGPGGRVLALPGASPEVRGLARAAMALDAGTVRSALQRAVQELGVVLAWGDVLVPVLVAVGERWAATGEGIEVEHLLAETATGVLRGVTDAPEPRNGRPVLLACTPGELHSLPLSALAAALSEHRVGVRLLGGSLPTRALVAAVRRTGPAALMVWAQQAENADVSVLDRLPLLRPPVAVLAGGIGWLGQSLPARVTYASDLTAAVALIGRAVGS
jgi:DNA-binding transcriptional MerR regulator